MLLVAVKIDAFHGAQRIAVDEHRLTPRVFGDIYRIAKPDIYILIERIRRLPGIFPKHMFQILVRHVISAASRMKNAFRLVSVIPLPHFSVGLY